MSRTSKKTADRLAKKALTKTAVKKTASVVQKGGGAIDVVAVLGELTTAYKDMRIIAAQEETKRQTIRSAERTTIARIEAQRELFMTYLDRTFDERRANFSSLFASLDSHIDVGDAAGAANVLCAVLELATASPLKGLESLESVRAAMQDPKTEFEL